MSWLETSSHPLIKEWFRKRFHKPSPPQEAGWPIIATAPHTLITAPTGSGKTLAAFMVSINNLAEQALAKELEDGVQVIYVSPLKALSNDVEKNLTQPLEEIGHLLASKGCHENAIRVGLRTGDTSPKDRQRLVKKPPHILVTTPESLYLLLTSEKARHILKPANTIIVDEIHALAGNKRGSHLSLTMARLDSFANHPLRRIGLSATVKPIELIAQFLSPSGKGGHLAQIVEIPNSRNFDLEIVTPISPLEAVLTHEGWQEVYDKLTHLISSHRSTLIFVNTRRMAERITHQLSQKLGSDAIRSHHGSLSKEKRWEAENLLKSGSIKGIIATASLELGIDVGYIDLVCQVGSPRSLGAFIQRIGRAGHSLGLTPKGRLFALTRDELIECGALIQGLSKGAMDAIAVPDSPIDILAQQIVAAVAVDEWDEDSLFQMIRTSYPFRNLSQEKFSETLSMLSFGLSETTRKGAYIHWDQVNHKLRPRKSAKLSALMSAGAIPEQNLYRVVIEAENTFVGTIDEDFAIESQRGDIFLLGNNSWQINRVTSGQVLVRDVHGAPPTIPFWFGEAPGRTIELSSEVSDLRQHIADYIDSDSKSDAISYLQQTCGMNIDAAEQAWSYLVAAKTALGQIPTGEIVIFERFFDDTQGMQVVIHAPFGAKINRAFGLALRKRFCRNFDFELQALADDNGLVLSTGPAQSFEIDTLFNLVTPNNLRDVLVQALLAVPMFQVRWRWNLTRSLAILRQKFGKRVPPHLQRFQADDLLTAVFPAQTQCFEHRVGDIPLPDHPLVEQTVEDCLFEGMDYQELHKTLERKKEGLIQFVAKETREASPMAHELLTAAPYTFLDDTGLENRRTRAVSLNRSLSLAEVADLTHLSPSAIDQVAEEAWPLVRNSDEMYDIALQWILIPGKNSSQWQVYLDSLMEDGRLRQVELHQQSCYYPSIKIHEISALFEEVGVDTLVKDTNPTITAIVRGYMESLGVSTIEKVSRFSGLNKPQILKALLNLQNTGQVAQGYFDNRLIKGESQWCERRLLFRIHRLTVNQQRKKIKPATLQQFQRFLCQHQGLRVITQENRDEIDGPSLMGCLDQLCLFSAPINVWEEEIIKSRVPEFHPRDLDELGSQGNLLFSRAKPKPHEGSGHTSERVRVNMAIMFFARDQLGLIASPDEDDTDHLSGEAKKTLEVLHNRGALFFHDLVQELKAPMTRVELGVTELITKGYITTDRFGAVRPNENKAKAKRYRSSSLAHQSPFDSCGRISIMPKPIRDIEEEESIEMWADILLGRYGILFRDLLRREPLAPQWGELSRLLRYKELTGEIIGGRFVKGVGGEQFATKEAFQELRSQVDTPPNVEELYILSGCDPANMSFLEEEELRVAFQPQNRVAILDGLIVGIQKGDKFIETEFTQKVKNKEDLKRLLRLRGALRSLS